MIAFVFGVIAAMICSGCTVKPSSGCVWHDHRRRIRDLDLLGNRRPVRRVRDHLVAGSNSASAVLKSACLPPTVINTSAGVMSMP